MIGRSVRKPSGRLFGFALRWAFLALAAVILAGCASHLKQAKLQYSEGQRWARVYETGNAAACYKRALLEAEAEVRTNPSAQAFMLKGMAEACLERWKDAERSFLDAFNRGFPEGEEWASDVSRFGLASSLAEMGLEGAALRSLDNLLNKSKFKPVLIAAAQKYVDLSLADALDREEKEKARTLADVVRTVEKLVEKDFACGFYHYLLSQAESHRPDLRKSFEEAVVAKELGLPSEKIFRDNDLQIVFTYQKLRESLPDDERKAFEARYVQWTKKWGWRDGLTPDWKSE